MVESLAQMLDHIGEDVKSAARQIYYARKALRQASKGELPSDNIHAAMFLLGVALENLGVVKPSDVGLSSVSLGEDKN